MGRTCMITSNTSLLSFGAIMFFFKKGVKRGFALLWVVAVELKGHIPDVSATVHAVASTPRPFAVAVWSAVATMCDVSIYLWAIVANVYSTIAPAWATAGTT